MLENQKLSVRAVLNLIRCALGPPIIFDATGAVQVGAVVTFGNRVLRTFYTVRLAGALSAPNLLFSSFSRFLELQLGVST